MTGLCCGISGLCQGMTGLCCGIAGLCHSMTELCHDIVGLCHDMVRVVLWDDIVMAFHGGQADRMGLDMGDGWGIAHGDRQTSKSMAW